MAHPTPYFRSITALNWFPQNRKVVKKFGNKYGTRSNYMVYDGPFTVKGWTGSSNTWKLVKNKDYWDHKAVKLNTVNYSVQKTPSTDYNLYQSGKLDGAFLDTQASKQLKNRKGYHIFNFNDTEYLAYNTSTNKYLRNVDLRRAFSMAINRKQLAQTAGWGNQPARTFASKTETVNNTNFVQYINQHGNSPYTVYNPTKAKQYFNKALKDLNTKKVTITLIGNDDNQVHDILEYLQSRLESTFGKRLNISVRQMPRTSRVNRLLGHNFESSYTGLSASYNDPYGMLNTMMTNGSFNFGKWNNKAYNQYLQKSSTEMNKDKRINDLYRAEQVLDNQQPLTPLFHDGQSWMVRTNLHGLEFDGSYFHFRDAYFK